MIDFHKAVLVPVRKHLGRKIQIPKRARWSFVEDDSGGTLQLDVDAAALAKNFQKNLPATPSFLICFAYWLERATGSSTKCRVVVHGPPPLKRKDLLHWRRTLFILEEIESQLAPRVEVHVEDRWNSPGNPVLNAPRGKRKSSKSKVAGLEHVLETSLCSSTAASDAFARAVHEIDRFERQLPLGLFGDRISRATAWTPGGKSQVDLWARSADGSTVHLFELKALDRRGKPNAPLGILPEALYYGRLLHHARVGLDGGRAITCNATASQAIQAARRLVVWLVAPDYHPLVFSKGRSPIEWFNTATRASGFEMRILPVDLAEDGSWRSWRFDEAWPQLPS